MKELGDIISVSFTQLPVDKLIIDYIENMTPKERALDLLEQFKCETKESELLERIVIGDMIFSFKKYATRKCALIAVEHCLLTAKYMPETFEYWNKVKHELEQL